jgi:hypothetical protein
MYTEQVHIDESDTDSVQSQQCNQHICLIAAALGAASGTGPPRTGAMNMGYCLLAVCTCEQAELMIPLC